MDLKRDLLAVYLPSPMLNSLGTVILISTVSFVSYEIALAQLNNEVGTCVQRDRPKAQSRGFFLSRGLLQIPQRKLHEAWISENLFSHVSGLSAVNAQSRLRSM